MVTGFDGHPVFAIQTIAVNKVDLFMKYKKEVKAERLKP